MLEAWGVPGVTLISISGSSKWTLTISGEISGFTTIEFMQTHFFYSKLKGILHVWHWRIVVVLPDFHVHWWFIGAPCGDAMKLIHIKTDLAPQASKFWTLRPTLRLSCIYTQGFTFQICVAWYQQCVNLAKNTWEVESSFIPNWS